MDEPQESRCPFLANGEDGVSPVCLSRPGDRIVVGARYVEAYCLTDSHHACSLFQRAQAPVARDQKPKRKTLESRRDLDVLPNSAPPVAGGKETVVTERRPSRRHASRPDGAVMVEPVVAQHKPPDVKSTREIQSADRHDGVIDVERVPRQAGPVEVVNARPVQSAKPRAVDQATRSRRAELSSSTSPAAKMTDTRTQDRQADDFPRFESHVERTEVSTAPQRAPLKVLPASATTLKHPEPARLERPAQVDMRLSSRAATQFPSDRKAQERQGSLDGAHRNLHIVSPAQENGGPRENNRERAVRHVSRLVLALVASAVLILTVGVAAVMLIHRNSPHPAAGPHGAASNRPHAVPLHHVQLLPPSHVVSPSQIVHSAPSPTRHTGAAQSVSPARTWSFPPIRVPADQVVLILTNTGERSVDVRIRMVGKDGTQRQRARIPPHSEAEVELAPTSATDTVLVRASGLLLAQRFVTRHGGVHEAPGSAGSHSGTNKP